MELLDAMLRSKFVGRIAFSLFLGHVRSDSGLTWTKENLALHVDFSVLDLVLGSTLGAKSSPLLIHRHCFVDASPTPSWVEPA